MLLSTHKLLIAYLTGPFIRSYRGFMTTNLLQKGWYFTSLT